MKRRRPTKVEEFEHAVTVFSDSTKDGRDVLALCVAASVATRPGQGLIWDQLKNIIDDNYEDDYRG